MMAEPDPDYPPPAFQRTAIIAVVILVGALLVASGVVGK